MCNRSLSSNWPPKRARPPNAGTPRAGWQLQWWSGAPRCVGRLQGCQIAFRLPNGHIDSLHQRAAATRCLGPTPLLRAPAAVADYQLRSCASDSRRGWHQVRCVLVSQLALLGSLASNMPPLSATKPVHTRTRGDMCSCCSCRRLLRLQDLHDHYSRAGQRSPGRSLPAQVPRDSERVDEVSATLALGSAGQAGVGWAYARGIGQPVRGDTGVAVAWEAWPACYRCGTPWQPGGVMATQAPCMWGVNQTVRVCVSACVSAGTLCLQAASVCAQPCA